MSAPVSSAARAGSDRRHCRPLPVRKPLGPAGTPNRDMFGPRPALFGFRPSEVGRQKRCGQRRERQKKKSCGHTLPGRRCDTEPSDSRHGKNAGSQYALFASRTVSSEAVQSPTVRRAVVAPASSRRKSPQILRRNLRRKRTGPLRSPNAGPNTSRAHHGTGTDEGRRQRNNDRDTAVKRQGSGETAERRQRNDRTAAEKQRSGDRETTGQQRRNSRDTAGKRQDSGAETAGTRRGNDRTAAQKQRNGGGTTAALTDEKRGDRSIPVPSPVAARRMAIARIPALGVPPAVNSRRSAPPCPRRCGSAFRGSRLPRGSASKGR